jgi:hypothetical protein
MYVTGGVVALATPLLHKLATSILGRNNHLSSSVLPEFSLLLHTGYFVLYPWG